MSVIYITNHDEVIYDSIKSRQEPRKIISRNTNFLNLNNQESNKAKKPSGTMGPATYTPPDPINYLHKTRERGARIEKPNKFERHCNKQQMNAPLEQKGAKIIHHDIDFVKSNVKVMKQTKPREPDQKVVITRNGDKVDATRLEPRFIYSKKFGRTPHYILSRVDDMGKLFQAVKDQEEIKTISNCRYITRQEREDLLNGLKQNWDEKQKEFQLLPMITDTIPKRNRKVAIENELKVLEKDILLVEQHPFIYIIDDD